MSHQLIASAFPLPRLGQIFKKSGSFCILLDSYTRCFCSGRAAVYWAFRGIDLPENRTAWMPDYHCGVEVQAVIDAGWNVRYYRVSKDLSIDEEDLERRLRICLGPVLLIHYFGFAQLGIERIAQLCRELDVPLIEDCAHALFSSLGAVPLGKFAPLSIFSLRKSLPIYDGGALLVNRFPFHSPPNFSPSIDSYKSLFKDIVRPFVGESLTKAIRRWQASDNEDKQFKPDWDQQVSCYRKGFSTISRRMASFTDPDTVVAARRWNWHKIHARLSIYQAHRPVWNGLPEGTCPLFYCFWVQDRDSLMNRLSNAGIETFRFGARPHPSLNLSAHPESQELRDSIIGFPVHQQLDSYSLNQALDILVRILYTS